MRYHVILAVALSVSAAAHVHAQSRTNPENQALPVLEEVIVTAQKIGQQNLLDVPLSVSAIGEEELARRNAQGMEDYLRYEPGTSFINRGTGRNAAIIRGITSDPGRGGVITGVYIDETPLHGLGLYETGSPDLGLVDIERVEVLRGPQGTLYGAGSMAGTVRTLTRAPRLDAFEGYLSAGGSETAGQGGFNNDLRAVVNVPLVEDRFAVRAVAYRFDESGFVRNTGASDPAKLAGVEFFGARLGDKVDDRGARTVEGFRVGALWHASERLDIRFTALGQRTEQDGIPTIDVRQGPYEQSRFARLSGKDESMSDDLSLYSLVLEYGTDNWSLVSASAWAEYEADIDWDVGLFFLDFFEGIEPPYWIYQRDHNEVFTQEVRWSWDSGGRWRAVLGAFYEDRDYNWTERTNFEGFPDPFEGFFDQDFIFDSNDRRESFFADTTFDITPQLEATAGFRDYSMKGGGFASMPEDRQSGETWKAGMNWRPEAAFAGQDALLYALWAEGFRPGFPVREPPDRCDQDGDGIIDMVGLPWEDIDFDDVSSVEIGYKAKFAQQRVAVEAAVFAIDWTGLRIDLPVDAPCASTMPFNAGSAKSEGFEFAMSVLLSERLQMNVSASWLKAELSKDGLLGPAGSRLPGSPDFNASLGLEYDLEIAGSPAWVRGDVAYVGDYYNTLEETPPKIGDFTTVSVSGGIDFDAWSLELFINNLTDQDALTWANPIWAPYDRETRLRPRTFGARLTYNFVDD